MITINKHTDIVRRKVLLRGRTDIMFDRYAGDNNTKLETHQKLYLSPDGSQVIGIPSVNLMSLLSAHNVTERVPVFSIKNLTK
jgi:hypothetical protein